MTLLLCGFVVVEGKKRRKRVRSNHVTIVGDIKACGQNENPYTSPKKESRKFYSLSDSEESEFSESESEEQKDSENSGGKVIGVEAGASLVTGVRLGALNEAHNLTSTNSDTTTKNKEAIDDERRHKKTYNNHLPLSQIRIESAYRLIGAYCLDPWSEACRAESTNPYLLQIPARQMAQKPQRFRGYVPGEICFYRTRSDVYRGKKISILLPRHLLP
jgi:hypothetical protein